MLAGSSGDGGMGDMVAIGMRGKAGGGKGQALGIKQK